MTPDFRKLFESLPGLYLILSPELIIEAVSDSYLKATMTERSEILGKWVFEVFPDDPDDPTATGVGNLNASLHRVLQYKKPDEMAIQKYDIRRPEGEGGSFEVRYWRPLNTPVLGQNNKVQYIIHKVEDVTEFVQAKEKGNDREKISIQNLKDTENRFHLLVENVKDYAIFMLDLNGIILSWNKGAEHIKGYTENEIVGKHFSIFYTEEEIKNGEPEHNLKMAKDLGRHESEGWRVRKDGSKFWADVIFTVLRDDSGNLKGFAKITRDITERKKADDEIKKSNERFFKIFNLSPEAKAIVSVDEGRYMYINKAFEKMFDIGQDEIVGKTSVEINLINKEERFRLLDSINENGYSKGVEIKLSLKNGLMRDFLISSDVVELDGKKCFLANFIDITERKEAEENIANLNQQLELNIAQLETANKELESFSYSVSHDLRAPLRAIDGYARVLMEDYYSDIDEEGKKSLNRIMFNAQKMGRLIDDLLGFSRIGRKEVQMDLVDMADIIRTVLLETNSDNDSKKVEFIVHPLNKAMADISMLKQVWTNLISNAIKYSRNTINPMVEIGSDQKGNEIIYYIKDNGVGFDMKYADKLFGVFQRLHKEREFEGTGVGLAIVQRIISKHGGRIWAESEVGKGATFYFTLPLSKQ